MKKHHIISYRYNMLFKSYQRYILNEHVKKVYKCIITVIFLVILSCGHTIRNVRISPALNKYKPKKYVILPFDNKLPVEQKKKYINASEIVRDDFEAAFIRTGNTVIERSKVDSLIEEYKHSQLGLSESRGPEIGKLLNADAVVFGAVTNFFGGNDFKGDAQFKDKYYGQYTTVGFTIKAVHVETGTILWVISSDCQVGSCMHASMAPQSWTGEVVKELVDELIKKAK